MQLLKLTTNMKNILIALAILCLFSCKEENLIQGTWTVVESEYNLISEVTFTNEKIHIIGHKIPYYIYRDSIIIESLPNVQIVKLSKKEMILESNEFNVLSGTYER